MSCIVLKRQNGKLILKPFQGEVGEPGQKGSKADKGEQVSKFNCIQNQFYLKYND